MPDRSADTVAPTLDLGQNGTEPKDGTTVSPTQVVVLAFSEVIVIDPADCTGSFNFYVVGGAEVPSAKARMGLRKSSLSAEQQS